MGKPENIENADKQSMDGTGSSGIHTTLPSRLRVRTQDRDAKFSSSVPERAQRNS